MREGTDSKGGEECREEYVEGKRKRKEERRTNLSLCLYYWILGKSVWHHVQDIALVGRVTWIALIIDVVDVDTSQTL